VAEGSTALLSGPRTSFAVSGFAESSVATAGGVTREASRKGMKSGLEAVGTPPAEVSIVTK
jgi:hypothetical protein